MQGKLRNRFCFIFLLLIFLLIGRVVSAQVHFDSTLSANQLVDLFLGEQGVRAGNVTYTGPASCVAYFKSENNSLGVESGIFLSTGKVKDAAGPNNSPWTTTGFSPPKSKERPKGDRDLNRISKSVTYDVAILEFDFIPFNNRISFSYVFASEEYPEYVGSRYNDVFGFIITGEKQRSQNLAVVPKTLLPVTINNINSKTNKTFYIDNDYFKKVDLKKNLPKESKKDKTPYTDYYETDKKKLKRMNQTLISATQFDGFTVLMNASGYVIPYKKYHMKIAIGDVGDPQYDSGVFLEEGSFTTVKDDRQPKFKEYADLSGSLNFDSLFGVKTVLSQTAMDSIVKAEEEYERFTITNINFATAKYVIPDSSKKELEALAEYLSRYPDFLCELYGYTDNIGSKKYNQQLSENRANAVMNYLLSKDVSPERIHIAGYNFENPIADNTDERGRAMNRRVEIILIEREAATAEE